MYKFINHYTIFLKKTITFIMLLKIIIQQTETFQCHHVAGEDILFHNASIIVKQTTFYYK